VSFGAGVTVTNVSVVDPTQISVTLDVAGGAALGLRDVTVTNVSAAQSATSTSAFEITDVPTVTAASGPLQQNLDNQIVVISGTNFEPPTSSNPSDLVVTFSGAGITVVSVGYSGPTSIAAIVNVSAAAALTSYDVTVINPDGGMGTGTAVLSVTDTAGLPAPPASNKTPPPPPPPPSITALTPNVGPLRAVSVIPGSNFSATAANDWATFAGANGARVPATVTQASTGSLTVTVPPAATTGSVTVAVAGLVSNGVPFTVTTPALTSLTPSTLT